MSDYASVSEVRAQTGDKSGTGDDPTISAIIAAVSRGIDRICNRPDGFVAPAAGTARLYAGSGSGFLRIDECAATPTLVEVKDSPSDSTYTAWVGADWIAARGDPENPDFNHTPYDLLLVDPTGSYSHFTSGRYSGMSGFRPDPDSRGRIALPTVKVTARFGYATTVPDPIRQATIIIAVQHFKRSSGAWTDALQMAEQGTLLFRSEVDPAARLYLEKGRYIRPAIG